MIKTKARRQRASGHFWRTALVVTPLLLATAQPLLAQGGGASPLERLITLIVEFVTGPLARGLSLVAIVSGGLTMAFAPEGFRHIGWLLFGIALALMAVQIMAWLFGL